MIQIRQIILILLLSCSTQVVKAQNEVDALVVNLQTANFSNLLPLWNQKVEVTLLDLVNQKQMTATEANQQLQLFFNNQRIIGFEKNAERKVGSTIYVTGKLFSNQNKYSLTLLLEQSKNKISIVSVRVS
jgi:hypothetical protein